MTSVFFPSPPNEIERELESRTYIYGQSPNVLVLDSPFSESKLLITNNLQGEGTYSNLFALSAKDETFVIERDDVVLAKIDNTSEVDVTTFVIPNGQLYSDSFVSSDATRKTFVIYDANTDFKGQHQFAGIGYSAGIFNYQVPVTSAQHIFYAGFDFENSIEMMRINRKDDYTQVGIGTTSIADGISLEVAGGNAHIANDLTVDGNFEVKGNFDVSQVTGVVTINPDTQKLDTNVLPSNVLFLDDNNKIDPQYLPSIYNGPYIRGLRNVGIGLRNPVQKLHVIGSTVTSERLGIGTAYPGARLHIYDSNISAPSVRIDKPSGDAIIVYGPDDSIAFNVSANGAVGIGTYNMDTDFLLRVAGGISVEGGLTIGSINVSSFSWVDENTTTSYMTSVDVVGDDTLTQPAIQAHIPFQAAKHLITPEIRYGGAPDVLDTVEPKVLFKNAGVHVEGKSIFHGDVALSNVDISGQAYFEVADDGLIAQELPTIVTDGRRVIEYTAALESLITKINELKARI